MEDSRGLRSAKVGSSMRLDHGMNSQWTSHRRHADFVQLLPIWSIIRPEFRKLRQSSIPYFS